jgi:hypothetical protein
MATLKLVARGPGGASCHLDATAAMSFLDLLKLLKAGLGLGAMPDDVLLARVKVLTGFPPRALALAAGDAIGAHLQHMGSLKVEVTEAQTTATEAASQAPTAKATAKKPPAKAKKAAVPPKKAAPALGRPNIHTLGGGPCSRDGGGREGSGSAGPKRRKLNIGGSSEEVGAALLSAQDGGGGQDARFWRRVMSSAVGNQYELTKAVHTRSTINVNACSVWCTRRVSPYIE